MEISLADRTALVTGSGRNIGRAIAVAMGAAGARVVCAYQRDAQAAEETARQIAEKGSDALVLGFDLTDVASIRAAVRKLEADGIVVDILVNNAAIRPSAKLLEVTADEWDLVHATNLRGPFFLSQAVLPGMIRQKWGRIINVGGIDAYRGSLNRPHVVASKLGLVGLGRALANETARDGITVNSVIPGLIDTPRYRPEWSRDIRAVWAEWLETIPMARLGTPDEVADSCVFLASDRASYITGQEILLTGGAHPLVRLRARES